MLGGTLIFGVAVVLIYGVDSWLSSSIATSSIFNAVLILSLIFLPYLIAKKILLNSVARREEATVLGVFLPIMALVASMAGAGVAYALSHPAAEWAKNFAIGASWDEFSPVFLRRGEFLIC